MGSQLQNGKQQFETILGTPLVGGKVYFYAPGTETPKATYQDQALTIANTNPVVLDARGQAIIWGSGTYRQVVVDAFGVQIWDQIVAANVSDSDLSGTNGAALIGLPDGTTLADSLTLNLNRVVDSIASLRVINHTFYARAFVTGYYAPHDGGGGSYQYDPADTSSLDNGGTIIVANDGGRWKLQATGVISVKQFGAKGDGTTDDTTTVQTAIDNGARYFPAGTYYVGKITLPSNIEPYGDGTGDTIIKLKNGTNDHLLYAESQSKIVLSGLTLDGNKANQTSGSIARCFYALDCSDISLDNVVVQNATDHGLHVSSGASTDPLTNTQRVRLNGCKFLNNGTVVSGNGGTGAAVSGVYIWATDCYSEGNILAGFKFIGQYVSAKGCYAIDNNAGGFTTGFDVVTDEGSVHVYESCYALNNGDGVHGGDGWRHQGQVDRIIHRDCFAIGNTWSGICLLANSTVKPTDIDVLGGSLMNNGQNLPTPANPPITSGAGFASLSTQSNPNVPVNLLISNVTITDTQATKTQQYGIYLNRGDSVYIGEGCRLAGNLTQSMFNAAASTSNINLSPQIISADFLARSNTPSPLTGTTSRTSIQSITVPANTFGIGQRFRVRARGTVTGTSGTKAIDLTIGNGSFTAISEVQASTHEWWLEGYFEISQGSTQKCAVTGVEVGGSTLTGMIATGVNVNTAITASVGGTLGSASDTITCSSFYFEPVY